ncbi:helix-turn-helix domain-containing protein [Povalibacter sp.]|uniref:helix-turn-helix domain-containing protein n=1 Tax=Povalibacter sp. TaxID=1962978 RepID=UPI002F3EF5D2
MADIHPSTDSAARMAFRAAHNLLRYSRIGSTDAVEFTEQICDWNFVFTQLKPGKLTAKGALLELDGISVGSIEISQTMLHQGHAPRGMVAILIPGANSGEVFAHAQRLESGQCVTLSEGAYLEAVTHGRYVDVALGCDRDACRAQLDALNDGSTGVGQGAIIAEPGQEWIEQMLARIDWLLSAVVERPAALDDAKIRASLSDHLLAAMVHFDSSPADVDSTTRMDRASRRVAVRIAREFIDSRLSEPLRLSELCRQAQLKIRSLEYGFREVTGLTPIAYIRSLRLNAVRRALLHDATARCRSISEIAMDAGFWHLSQFAKDYRLFFGETPTQTRRRGHERMSTLQS